MCVCECVCVYTHTSLSLSIYIYMLVRDLAGNQSPASRAAIFGRHQPELPYQQQTVQLLGRRLQIIGEGLGYI